jgi:nicotinamidase-related amidase
MLLQAKDSAVMLIDAQEKLMPLVHHRDDVESNCEWILRVAKRLQIPVVTTEQYPKGLGSTLATLKPHIDKKHVYDKVCFSAMGNPGVASHIYEMKRKQWVLIGIESHVCVLQTAVALQENGHQVFVVAEATSSRSFHDRALGFSRMEQIGVQLVSKEMVLYEWLAQAGSDLFKELNTEFVINA